MAHLGLYHSTHRNILIYICKYIYRHKYKYVYMHVYIYICFVTAHIRLSHSSTPQKNGHSAFTVANLHTFTTILTHTHMHTHTRTQSPTRTHAHVHSHVLINGHAATTVANLHTLTTINATSTRNLNSCREREMISRFLGSIDGIHTHCTTIVVQCNTLYSVHHTATQLLYSATHYTLCTTMHHTAPPAQ